jgi:hypothetical protein
MGHRQVGLFVDPLLLHSLRELVGVFLFQFELGVQDYQLVETALAVGKDKVAALARDDLSGAGHYVGAARPLSDVAGLRAGIAVERAADRAGNADERL